MSLKQFPGPQRPRGTFPALPLHQAGSAWHWEPHCLDLWVLQWERGPRVDTCFLIIEGCFLEDPLCSRLVGFTERICHAQQQHLALQSQAGNLVVQENWPTVLSDIGSQPTGPFYDCCTTWWMCLKSLNHNTLKLLKITILKSVTTIKEFFANEKET